MPVSPTELWPWLALAGLGLFHGINPAMGWLFAVALGLNRGNRRIVLLSLVPIALGHAAAVTAVLFAGLMLVPILLPICASAAAPGIDPGAAIPLAFAAVGIHSLAMLAAIAAISL